MKVKNKQTGEIRVAEAREDGIYLYDELTGHWWKYELDLLASGWEYYEEPEGWWFIDRAYEPHATNSTLRSLEADKQIGNHFETKEEAEKAVEKLKAWQRLKDKGFRFVGCVLDNYIRFELPYMEWYKGVSDDLDLLFGGEE